MFARCTTPCSMTAQSAGSMISGSSSSDQGRCAAPCVAEDVVGDAVVADLPRHLRDAAVQVVGQAAARRRRAAAGRRSRASAHAAGRRLAATRPTRRRREPDCVAAVQPGPRGPRPTHRRQRRAARTGTGSAARRADAAAQRWRRSSVNGNSRLGWAGCTDIWPRRVAHADEARQAPAFRRVGIDREVLVAQAAGVRDVVLAAAHRPLQPAVDDVEGQRRMHADGRVQRRRRLPGAVAHAADVFADAAGGLQRQRLAVGGDDVAVVVQPA